MKQWWQLTKWTHNWSSIMFLILVFNDLVTKSKFLFQCPLLLLLGTFRHRPGLVNVTTAIFRHTNMYFFAFIKGILNFSSIFLKVLSSEMDPAEIMFIRKVFIKERGAEVFRKISLSPILWERIANGAHSSFLSLSFTTYSCWQRRYEQIWRLLPFVPWTFEAQNVVILCR